MTPRERFQSDKASVRQLEEFADNAFLNSTLDTALAEMTWRYNNDVPDLEAANQAQRLKGAMTFLTIWRGLATVTRTASRIPRDDSALLPEDALPPKSKQSQ